MAYYLLAWLGLMWGFLVARRDSLNPVERASTAIHFGAKFGCVAILPVQLWLHDGNPVYALPSFLVLVGLATFVHGVTYWGRLYLSGLALLAVAAAMPLVPVTYWPAVYGALLAALQLLMGFHLRRVHNDAEAERQRAKLRRPHLFSDPSLNSRDAPEWLGPLPETVRTLPRFRHAVSRLSTFPNMSRKFGPRRSLRTYRTGDEPRPKRSARAHHLTAS